jgi:hypothetical protein
MAMKFTMTAPCVKCPFRTDIEPFLRPQRVKEIVATLLDQQGTFQCHATVDYSKADEDGEVEAIVAAHEPNAQHCAGAMIMLEHMNRPNQMMRICERIGHYDRRKLDMDAPVYRSARAMVARHTRWRGGPRRGKK